MVTASVTVVEAPAGYGKTTAIRKAFADFDKKQVFYFTAVREEALVSYHRLCTLIYEIDPEMGQELLDLGLPNRTNSEQIGRCLRNIQTDQETWLVLDNLHYLERKLDISLLKVFSDPLCPRLHIVLITQLLSRHRYSLFENPYLNTIKTSDFSLRAPEIADFFHSMGSNFLNKRQKKSTCGRRGGRLRLPFCCAVRSRPVKSTFTAILMKFCISSFGRN